MDDAGYLRALINEISRKFAVDRKRIYLIGHSNGGFMAHRMACENADLIAGIVSLAGATLLHPEACAPSGPVNILQIGTADPTIPYGGGHPLGTAQQFPNDFPPFPAAMETIRLWADRNRCTDPVTDLEPTLDLDLDVPGPDTFVTRFTTCPPGGAVELWTIQGGVTARLFSPTPRPRSFQNGSSPGCWTTRNRDRTLELSAHGGKFGPRMSPEAAFETPLRPLPCDEQRATGRDSLAAARTGLRNVSVRHSPPTPERFCRRG